MCMRVVEARQHRAALGVDDDRLRSTQALDFAVGPDTDDLVAGDCEGLRQFGAAVGRIDLAVDDDQIDRTIVVSLRADDEAGDESHPDNERHGICREAGRH